MFFPEGSGAEPGGTGPVHKKLGKKRDKESEKNAARVRHLAAHKEPTFFIGGGNGNSLLVPTITFMTTLT